jgi:hypothetical protein
VYPSIVSAPFVPLSTSFAVAGIRADLDSNLDLGDGDHDRR